MIKRDGDKENPEPFAEEAKYFTEARLLQRDVKVVLEGVSNQLVLATVLHPVSRMGSVVCSGILNGREGGFMLNPGRKHCRVVAETGVCSMCRLEYGVCLKRKRQAKSCRKVNSHLAQSRVCLVMVVTFVLLHTVMIVKTNKFQIDMYILTLVLTSLQRG